MGSLGMATAADFPGEALDPPRTVTMGISISGHELWQPEGPPEPLETPQAVLFQQRRAGRLDPTHPTAHNAALCVTMCFPHTLCIIPLLTQQLLPAQGHQWHCGLGSGSQGSPAAGLAALALLFPRIPQPGSAEVSCPRAPRRRGW